MIRIDDNTVFNPENGEFGYLPDIIQFEVDTTLLTDSTPAIITWTVSNATKVLLNNESVEPTGIKEFHSYDLIEVVLIAENELGQTTPRKIAIDIDRTPPIIHSFTINEQFAIKGYPIKLSWNVEGAHSLMIDNGVGSVIGLTEKITTLGSNGVYKLTAKNYFGIESTIETAILVFPTPIIENLYIPTPIFSHQTSISNFTIETPKIDLGIDLNSNIFKQPTMDFEKLNSNSINYFHSNNLKKNPISEVFEIIQDSISQKLKQIFTK